LLDANRGQACNKSTGPSGLSGNQEKQISLYPNPIVTKAILDVDLSENRELSVQIVDPLGRMVGEKKLGSVEAGSSSHELDFSDVQAGIYFVNITTGASVITKRIFVTK